jgi:periplasmic divalent cation tolerance protein
MIFVYITNPSEKEAKKIATMLIDQKLIACANIFPVSSIYKWEGKVVDEKEFVLIAKTAEKNYGKVVEEVEKIHPYKIPCITKIPVTPNEKYSKWLKSQLK